MKKLLLILCLSSFALTLEANRIKFINLTKHNLTCLLNLEHIEWSRFGFFSTEVTKSLHKEFFSDEIWTFDYETPENFLTDHTKSHKKFVKVLNIEIIDDDYEAMPIYKCNKKQNKALNDTLLQNENVPVYIQLDKNGHLTLSTQQTDSEDLKI